MTALLKFLCVLVVLVASALASTTVTDLVYLDVNLDDISMGRILVGLYGDDVPLATLNFKNLAQGTAIGAVTATYSGTEFFSFTDNYVAGGDWQNNDGTASTSATGSTFDREDSASITHNAAGLVSMIGDSNGKFGSQFLITLQSDTTLDRTNVVVGKVMEGMGVVQLVTALQKSSSLGDLKTITISASGIVY
jgi:cyclophilin family peptidyl-prolyl cis-trans isomerase